MLLLFFVLFLLPLSIYSADIKATVTKEQNIVEAGGEAFFTIFITNQQIRDDTFTLKVSPFNIAPFSDVIKSISFKPTSTITISPNQQKTVKAKVRFLDNARSDRSYIIPIEIKSINNPRVKEILNPTIFVISPKEIVEIDANIPKGIVPGRKNPVDIKLKNNANVRLSNADIFYTSSIFNFKESLNINPLSEKTVKLNIELDPLTEKGNYPLSIRIYEGDKLRGNKNFEFYVGENPDLIEKQEIDKGFLSSKLEIIHENKGNIEIERTIKYPTTLLQRIFTSTDPKGKIIKDQEQTYYAWNFKIPAGSSYKIKITTNYQWIFYLVIVILILIGTIRHQTKKDLKLTKELVKVTEGKQENFEVKILLHLKNKTDREMFHIKLFDFLPRYVHTNIDFSTLKPNKIEQGSRGRRLLWEVTKLDPKEEIIISYRVASKMKLIGNLNLPSAYAQYFGRKKRLVHVKSNRISY